MADQDPITPSYQAVLNSLITEACKAEEKFSLDELEDYAHRTQAEADARRDLEEIRTKQS